MIGETREALFPRPHGRGPIESRRSHLGSAARGECGPDSDLDFLVVVSDDAPAEIFRGGGVYRLLAGIPLPVDVIPWRQTGFDALAAYVVASLPATVKREGRLLYDSSRMAA